MAKKKGKKKSVAELVENLTEKFKKTLKKDSFAVDRPVKEKINEISDEVVDEQKLVTVTSPLAGIFHSTPFPESPPFFEIGSSVGRGQILCIIEAMKLMNEIESESSGTLVKIFVENGQPVEKGKPLFLIKP